MNSSSHQADSPSILYATSWGNEGAFTYISTDSGESWTSFQQNLRLSKDIYNVHVSPFYSNMLIANIWTGTMYSNDAGNTWDMTYELRDTEIPFENIEFSTDNDIVYGSAEGLKMYKSINGGISFSLLHENLEIFISD
ncbi:MAG: hypothetical protein JRI67_06795 [Deltaproteobacteria bacterium]|nr:hypothetical protein [Deltaproteobacteria bacterium]MBW1938458.1 hypothetical protein [Deltaproteobacteria bacterium]MBW1965484.1 hypothetical protein [Deltaproteobacteria bacterium]